MKGLLISMAVAGGIGLLSACQPSEDSSTDRGLGEAPRVGYRAPNFRSVSLEGEETSLAGLRGKVVFLNFWATWCEPCKAEMPSMEILYRDFKGRGFEILAISNDFQGAAVVRPFVEELGLSYPILLDPDFWVHEKYLIQSVPTSYIVDRDGIITHKLIGARNWSTPEFRDLVDKLLEAKT